MSRGKSSLLLDGLVVGVLLIGPYAAIRAVEPAADTPAAASVESRWSPAPTPVSTTPPSTRVTPSATRTSTPARTTSAVTTTPAAPADEEDLPDINIPNPDLPGHRPRIHLGGGGHHKFHW